MTGVELVTSWLTPTVLFCILNLMIGTIFIASSLNPHTNQQNLGDNSDERPPQLGRVPSFFERVRSFNLSRYQSRQPDPAHYAIPAEDQEARQQKPDCESSEEAHHVTRSTSETVRKTAPAARVLKKSASEKVAAGKREEAEEEDQRRPATVREKTTVYGGEDEAVDAKADDFINRFRQQLKLQRLDSILRYTEMLKRGTGK